MSPRPWPDRPGRRSQRTWPDRPGRLSLGAMTGDGHATEVWQRFALNEN